MMRGRIQALVAGLSLVLLLAVIAGCKKRAPIVPTAPPASANPADQAPTIALSAEPMVIAGGASSVLSWTTTHATEVEIENIGKFPSNGSTIVRPQTSTTYMAIATGSGGKKSAQIRITVTGAAPSAPSGEVKEQPQVEEHPLSVEEIFNSEIHDVFYDFDKYDLKSESKETLHNDAQIFISRIPQASILIEGHCDERGTEEYNLALGDKRANAARDFLISLGVPGSRIQTISYGEERPFDPGHNEDAWAKNRRAHFVLIKQ